MLTYLCGFAHEFKPWKYCELGTGHHFLAYPYSLKMLWDLFEVTKMCLKYVSNCTMGWA